MLNYTVLWILSTETSWLLRVCVCPGQYSSLPATSGSPQVTHLSRRSCAQSGAQFRPAHISEALPDAGVSRLCSLSARGTKSVPSALQSLWYKWKGRGCWLLLCKTILAIQLLLFKKACLFLTKALNCVSAYPLWTLAEVTMIILTFYFDLIFNFFTAMALQLAENYANANKIHLAEKLIHWRGKDAQCEICFWWCLFSLLSSSRRTLTCEFTLSISWAKRKHKIWSLWSINLYIWHVVYWYALWMSSYSDHFFSVPVRIFLLAVL